jgi:hypothetical protein
LSVVQAYEKVSPRINDLIDKASPYVKSTLEEVNRVATPAAKELTSKAAPVITVCPVSVLLVPLPLAALPLSRCLRVHEL